MHAYLTVLTLRRDLMGRDFRVLTRLIQSRNLTRECFVPGVSSAVRVDIKYLRQSRTPALHGRAMRPPRTLTDKYGVPR